MSQSYNLVKTPGKVRYYLVDYYKNVPDLCFSYEIGQVVAKGSSPFISYINYEQELPELNISNRYNIFSFDIFSIIFLELFTFVIYILYYFFVISRQREKCKEINKLLDKNIVPIVIYSTLFAIGYFFIILLFSKLLFKPVNMYFLWLSFSIDIFLFVCSLTFLKNILYFIGGKILSIFNRNKEYSDIALIVAGFTPYFVLFMLVLLLWLPRIVIYFITTSLVSIGLFGDIYYSISKRKRQIATTSSSD